jgi:hypothetical protein
VLKTILSQLNFIKKEPFSLLFAITVFSGCILKNEPVIANSVTRKQTIKTALAYSKMGWKPSEKNVFHANDANEILVHTPDASLPKYKFNHGWWKPNEKQKGMPYKWGGFDTPKSFVKNIKQGMFAGDIGGPLKQQGGDSVVSKYATGIDCSGYVSRCWKLPRPYSTRELPAITDSINWKDLKPGDILIGAGHVVLFSSWGKSRNVILVYEAGPFPQWKVSANALSVPFLKSKGYTARRYKNMTD